MNRRRSRQALVALLLCASGAAYGLAASHAGGAGFSSPRTVSAADTRQEPSESSGAESHGRPTDVYRDIQLEHDVVYHIEAYVGAAVMWISHDNPTIADGSIVRPVSIMAIATWKEKPLTRTHMLYWLDLKSPEGLVASISVLGTQFSDPDVPPRSRVGFEVRPRTTWADVNNEADVLVTAELRAEAPVARPDSPATPPTKK